MELHAGWLTGSDGSSELHHWIALRADQRCVLRAILARPPDGVLHATLSLKVGRKWEELEATPITKQEGSRVTLDFSLKASQLRISKGTFRSRHLKLDARLRPADSGPPEHLDARVAVLPILQLSLAKAVRILAFVPLVPLLYAYYVKEIPGEVAAWYSTAIALLGLMMQERPLSRLYRGLHDKTFRLAPLVFVIVALVVLELGLLVRVENRTQRPLILGNTEVAPGKAGLLWRWNAPTIAQLASKTPNRASFAITRRELNQVWFEEAFSLWAEHVVCCRRFHIDCEREPQPKACAELAQAQCGEPAAPKNLRLDGFVDPGPGCTVAPEVLKSLPIEVVLGDDDDQSAKACQGNYYVALSERAAYSGDTASRNQYAHSFTLLTLPHGPGLDARWSRPSNWSTGVMSLTVPAPRSSCQVMIPTRTQAFDVELRDSAGLVGTLQCPPGGSCPHGLTVVEAYTPNAPTTFDGMEAFAVDHGRSSWSYGRDDLRAFTCRCIRKGGEKTDHRPIQASLRLGRAPPESLSLTFDQSQIPERLEIAAGKQRSVLHCKPQHADTPPKRLTVQPLQLPFVRHGHTIDVASSLGSPVSSWRWVEGDNQAWSCVPVDPNVELEVIVDRTRRYPYRRYESHHDLELPDCYIHPDTGEVKTSPSAFNDVEPNCWQGASAEGAASARRRRPCGRVMACVR